MGKKFEALISLVKVWMMGTIGTILSFCFNVRQNKTDFKWWEWTSLTPMYFRIGV